MEFTKERSVCTIIKAIHLDAITLDEILHHLDTIHIRSLLVHEIDIILPALHEVFLCHLADLLRFVDDIIFSHLLISPVNGKITPHDATSDKSLFLILDCVHHWLFVGIKCLEIGHDCRVIHQGDPEHSGLLIGDDRIIHRDASYCNNHIVFFL